MPRTRRIDRGTGSRNHSPFARLSGLRVIALLLLVVALVTACRPRPVETPEAVASPTVPSQAEPTAIPQTEPALTETSPAVEGTLTVHYIDVGQSDATLLQGPDVTILIDAGNHDRDDVVPYLQSVGVESLDLLVGTHPHADHIGQFPQVLAAYEVSEVWLPGDEQDSRTFERTLDAILDSDADYHEPRTGEVYDFGSLRVEVYSPDELTGAVHDGSICLRIRYGEVAFFFTGDAEVNIELEMIERGHDLRANVLQLGHHGSSTSSHPDFLQSVQPEVAVYSAAQGNSYGHPHDEVVERIADMGIRLYGTDQHGTIRVITDGDTYEVIPERNGEPFRHPASGRSDTTSGCAEGQIDINTASRDELMRITHISEVRADLLIEYRPFDSVDDLARIEGIGPARLGDIKEQELACVP
ncbi:MAG TPA: MBL fold metallo-hydrolase [Chloroflexi bacterium]|nr:MBL fold metallo-hydrolase [Chloroflexota bacterium]